MKPASFLLVLGIGILIGGGIGWAIRAPGEEVVAGAVEPSPQPLAGKPARPASAQSRVVQDEFRKISTQQRDPNANYDSWEFSDLKELALALLKNSDPINGLPYEQRSAFNSLIVAMARKDRDGTLAWIDVSFPLQRFEFYQAVINDQMKTASSIEQLDFLMSRNFDQKAIGTYAGSLLYSAGTSPTGQRLGLDTDTALYLLKYINPSEGSYSSSNGSFSADFDFARFAAATAEKAKADGNKPPDTYPSNFFEEWARQSPQEAIDFFFAHCTGKEPLKLPYNGIDKILSGVKSSIPAGDYAAWLGQTIWQQYQSEKPDQNMINTMIYQELSNPELLGTALDSITDSSIKDKLLGDTLRAAAESSAHNPDGIIKLRGTLALYQDPAERLDQAAGFAKELGQRRNDGDVVKIVENLCIQLTNLGHPEADLQRVRASAGK